MATLFEEIISDEMEMMEFEAEQYFNEVNRQFDDRTEQQAISDLINGRVDADLEAILFS